MTALFADREYGAPPPSVDAIDARVWSGLQSHIAVRLGNGSFGHRFPKQCPDGYAACGCDHQSFQRVVATEIPRIEWPASPEEVSDTSVMLDLLEFCAAAAGEPIQGAYHSFFRNHHLGWDREAGLNRFVKDVNLVLARNGVAYELTASGEAR